MRFMFIPTWGNDPILRAYFSDGLKPPTSIHFAAPIDFSACFFDVVAAISLQNVLHNPPPPCEILRGLEIQTNDFRRQWCSTFLSTDTMKIPDLYLGF